MPIPDDVDVELLISRLAGPLLPVDRVAFRRAAEDALARVSCPGPGSVYRAIAALQRAFFTPPTDASWGIENELGRHQRSKLINRPAIR